MAEPDLRAMMPFARLIGLEPIEVTAERVTGRMTVRPDLCTVGGVLHGGAAMAMADSLAGVAAYLALPADAKGTTTVESKTNFLGPAREGTMVTATVEPVKIGRRISVWTTRILGEDGTLVAQVTQTQMAL